MVTACKLYIISGSSERVWDMDRKPLVEKLQNSCKLYKTYQDIFHKTKEKIEKTPGQKPFEFSEMYIFGKFETFCKRLEKVIYL
jgi:dynein heavy chain